MSSAHHASMAGQREWIGLAVIALPCMLYSMDLTVLNLAVPHLTRALNPTSTQLLWIVDIYGFVLAGMLIPMGTLGDRVGRRRLLLIGAVAFGAASLLAAFSTSAEMLIATRAILGIAAATLAPSTLSLLRNMFLDAQQRTFAISVWIMSFSLGAVIGPLIGGALLQYFWWGSVFLIAVPAMILLLILGPMFLPTFRKPDPGRLDFFSAVLSLVSVLLAIHGLKHIAYGGVALIPLVTIAAGVAVGFAFVRRQRRLTDPMIDLHLFRIPAFNATLAANTLTFFANFGIFLFVAQYLQLVLGMSPLQAGLWSTPAYLGFVVGSILTPAIVRHVAPARVMPASLVVAAGGLVILTQTDRVAGLPILVAGSVVFALGLAPVTTLATDIMVGTAPPERAGAAAAISETSSEFGGALGIAVLGSIGTAVYRGIMTRATPDGVPRALLDDVQDTLGAAVAVASQIAESDRAALLDVARDAFARAFEIVNVTAAVILVAAGVIAALLVRPVRAEGTEGTATMERP